MAASGIVAGFEGTTVLRSSAANKAGLIGEGSFADNLGSDADLASDRGASADPAARRPAPLPADEIMVDQKAGLSNGCRGPECPVERDGRRGPAFPSPGSLCWPQSQDVGLSTSTSLRCWTALS